MNKPQMNKQRGLVLVLLVVVCLSQMPRASWAAEDGAAKNSALKWIDGFWKVQVLFSDKDIQRLRGELAEGSEAKATAWLSETEKIRKALDSDRWNETRTWLKKYLDVQAIYSDAEVAEFRTKAKETAKKSREQSTTEFIDLLKDIERKRKRFASRATNAQQVRKQQVSMAAAYQQRQVAQRSAARRSAASINTTGQGNTFKKRQYRRPPPLIDSLDAARMEVMRNFYRRR
jgi:hypothetical protein